MLSQYVSSFETFDDMIVYQELSLPGQRELRSGPYDEHGSQTWKPAQVSTPRRYLEALYEVIPSRFPPLYEQLILSYRWGEVELDRYTLLANPTGDDLSGLLGQIQMRHIWDALIPNGFLQFAKGPDLDFDPV